MKIFSFLISLLFLAAAAIGTVEYQNGNFETAKVCYAINAVIAIGAIASSDVRSTVFGVFGSPGLEALTRNAPRFGLKTKEEINNIWAPDDVLYIRKQITSASGIHKLADNTSSYGAEAGVRNVDRNKLPEGKNFAIEAIWLAQGNHATVTDPKDIINYTNVMSSVEAELRSAELVITQDSKEILRLPVSSLLSPAAATNGNKRDNAFQIKENCPVLIENTPFEINIEFPATLGTLSTSTNKFHIELELYGKGTKKRFV